MDNSRSLCIFVKRIILKNACYQFTVIATQQRKQLTWQMRQNSNSAADKQRTIYKFVATFDF